MRSTSTWPIVIAFLGIVGAACWYDAKHVGSSGDAPLSSESQGGQGVTASAVTGP